jgi:hypothetical protein
MDTLCSELHSLQKTWCFELVRFSTSSQGVWEFSSIDWSQRGRLSWGDPM